MCSDFLLCVCGGVSRDLLRERISEGLLFPFSPLKYPLYPRLHSVLRSSDGFVADEAGCWLLEIRGSLLSVGLVATGVEVTLIRCRVAWPKNYTHIQR